MENFDFDSNFAIATQATQIAADLLLESSNIFQNVLAQTNLNGQQNDEQSHSESDDDMEKILISRLLKKRNRKLKTYSKGKSQQIPKVTTKSTTTGQNGQNSRTAVVTTKDTKKNPNKQQPLLKKNDLLLDETEAFVTLLRNCDDLTFQTHFKLTKKTFEALQQMINPQLNASFNGEDTSAIILSSLWMLTTNESTRIVASRFDFKKSKFHRIFSFFCKIIFNNQQVFNIQLPSLKEQQYRSIEQFNKLGDEDGIIFPNICGILGCTTLSSDLECDVRLQCLCDANGLFLDCFISSIANYSNSMIFQQSKLFERLETDPTYPLPGSQLIADKTYPLRRYLYVPYKHLPLSSKEQKFNKNLIFRKQIIDNAFLQLKERFIKLKYLSLGMYREQQQYVIAACALHNFCIQQGDSYNLNVYQKITDETEPLKTAHCEVTTDDDLTVEINRTNFLRLIK